MKKLMALLLSAGMLLGVTACGQKEDPASAREFETGLVQELVRVGAFSEELEELDGDTAFMLYRFADYGMAREDLTDAAVLRSAGATCEEVAVLIFADEEKAAAAAEALGDYLDSQIESNEDYRPNEIPKLQGAVLKVEGKSVLLTVPNDAAAVRSVFE